jgi:YD repeat-containing protein
MKIYPITICWLSCMCAFFSAYAQTSYTTPSSMFDLKNILPTSPEAAMLGKFGDIPIGYYTGTGDVSIPLYTIKEGGIEIPIVLRYHGSGNRVEDDASEVGLGWSLEPGGSVVQAVNGVQDGLDDLINGDPVGYNFLQSQVAVHGIISSRFSVGNGVYPCFTAGPAGTEDSKRTLDLLIAGNGQPDVYQYSMPGGHSGKFYINPETKQIVLLDKKDDITFVNQNGWIATTMDGTVFTFGAGESATTSLSTNITGFTSKLSKIALPDGKTINFDYTSGYYQWFTYNETFHSEYPFNLALGEVFVKPSSDQSIHNVKYLHQITAPDITIVFNLEDRIDMIGSVNGDGDGDPSNGTASVKRIKSVDIIQTATGKKIKTFNFTYDYFSTINTSGYVSTTNAAVGKRLKLLSVQETGYDDAGNTLSNPPYSFTYDERVALPGKTSFARDYWGYYNGQTGNTKMIPDISYFYNAGYYPSDMPLSLMTTVNGANRATDTSKTQAYLLKRVKYPTGGFTEFDYECNSFNNYNYPDQNKITTTTKNILAQDLNQTGDPTTVQFTLSRTLTLQFRNNVTAGTKNYTFANVSPSTITLSETVSGTTTVLATWQLSASDQTEFDAHKGVSWTTQITLPYTLGAVYTLKVNFPDNLVPDPGVFATASVSSACSYQDIPTQTGPTISYGGGSRVSAIRNYNAEGNIVSNKVLHYVNADGTTSGLLMSKLKNASTRMMHFEAQPDPKTAQFVVTGQPIWFLSSESFTPFSNAAGGNIVGYSRVEEISLAADGTTNGKKVYTYHNAESQTGDNVPDNPDVENGMAVSEETYDASNNMLRSDSYHYTDLKTDTYTATKAFNDYVLGWSCTGTNTGYMPQYDNFSVLYLYYPLNSHWYVMDNKTSSENANGITLTKTEAYTYNSKGQQVKMDTYDSRQRKMTTSTVYPIDAPTMCGADLLINHSMYDQPLEITSLVNDVAVADTRICYTLSNGAMTHVVKSGITNAYNGGTPSTDVTFDLYGLYDNIQQVTQRGTTTSILWSDDNLYPIAEVQNAAYGQIAFTSFEDRESGRFIIPAAGISTNNPHSGLKCYDVSVATIGIGLDPQTTYKIGYWTTNAGPFSLTGTVGSPLKGATSGSWTYYEHNVTGQHGVSFTGSGLLDDVRVFPAQSLMTSYVNLPLIGLSMMMGPDGRPAYYKYDALGRLLYITDKDGNILKQYNYNYGNTPQ